MTCIIFLYIFFKKFQRSPSLTLDFMFRRKKRKETKKNNNNNKLYWGMYWRSHQKCWSNFPSQFATFEALFHSDQIGRSSTQPKPSCRTDPEGIQLWCWMPPPQKNDVILCCFSSNKEWIRLLFFALTPCRFQENIWNMDSYSLHTSFPSPYLLTSEISCNSNIFAYSWIRKASVGDVIS